MKQNVMQLYLKMARGLVRQVKILEGINQEYFCCVMQKLKQEGMDDVIKKEELAEIRLNSARILSISEEIDTIVSKLLLINSSDNSISEETKRDKK